MVTKTEGKERILSDFERSIEEIFERVKEVADKNPEVASRLYEAVQRGYKRGRKKAYESMRLRVSVSLPPRLRPYFEACVNYAYSKGWISRPTNAQFARWAIEVVIENILKKAREEDEQIARAEEEFRS